MQPADEILVQKCLSATLAKVAEMTQGLLAAKATLKQQERALYEATKDNLPQSPVAPIKSPSILDDSGDPSMRAAHEAIAKLAGLSDGCDCPNLEHPSFLINKQEGT